MWSPPPPLTSTIRVAAQGRTYAFLRVPFGWHQAPALVQALISDLLRDLGRGGVVVVQYLDDILFVGHDPGEVAAVTDSAAHLLRRAGFIISEKSVFTPQRSLRWMGKDVDLSGRRVAPAASAVAAVVAAWVRLALKPYTYVALRQLLGKLGWLARPGNLGGVLSGRCPVLAALGPALGLAHTAGSGARALRGHCPVLQGLGARHQKRRSGSARLCGRRQVCPDHRS